VFEHVFEYLEPVGWGDDLDPRRPTRPAGTSGGGRMRRIDESIESLAPAAPPSGPGSAFGAGEPGAPLAFRWRGRRYVVGSVLAQWVETGAWWRRPVDAGRQGAEAAEWSVPVDPERRLWRVEACRGAETGVFDLCLEVDDRGPGRWSLHTIHD
jgi:hypothetical protein